MEGDKSQVTLHNLSQHQKTQNSHNVQNIQLRNGDSHLVQDLQIVRQVDSQANSSWNSAAEATGTGHGRSFGILRRDDPAAPAQRQVLRPIGAFGTAFGDHPSRIRSAIASGGVVKVS